MTSNDKTQQLAITYIYKQKNSCNRKVFLERPDETATVWVGALKLVLADDSHELSYCLGKIKTDCCQLFLSALRFKISTVSKYI